MKKSKKVKALVLFSGGLDSNLACKILEAQKIDVTAVCFTSNFFGCKNAKISAEKNNLKLKIIDIGDEILKLVKNPPHGHGKNMNPCIDCHALMMKQAGKFLKENGGGYDFIASGEVLGQRPFSQNKQALAEVKKTAGIDIVRPMSAKFLPETKAEISGLVDREKLEDVSGRRRERQAELAKKYKLKYYPSPGGGCLLTEKEFGNRLKTMIDKVSDCTTNDVEILKHGRVFWLGEKENILVVIGRNKEDNEMIERLAQKGDIMIELKEIMGPLTLVRSFNNALDTEVPLISYKQEIPDELNLEKTKNKKDILKIACILTGYYAVKARGREVELVLMRVKK